MRIKHCIASIITVNILLVSMGFGIGVQPVQAKDLSASNFRACMAKHSEIKTKRANLDSEKKRLEREATQLRQYRTNDPRLQAAQSSYNQKERALNDRMSNFTRMERNFNRDCDKRVSFEVFESVCRNNHQQLTNGFCARYPNHIAELRRR